MPHRSRNEIEREAKVATTNNTLRTEGILLQLILEVLLDLRDCNT